MIQNVRGMGSEGDEVGIVVLITIVFIKKCANNSVAFCVDSIFFLLQRRVLSMVLYWLPLMEFILFHIILEGILCFIVEVKFCQARVLLFYLW